MGDVVPFRRGFTLNVDFKGDGFQCMVCGHWLWLDETEWGDMFRAGNGRFGHMHGTEPFHYCPNCGAQVLELEHWCDVFPEDGGKSVWEIERRYYERGE